MNTPISASLRSTFLVAVALLGGAVAPAAHADDAVPSITVHYGDLNLGRPAGAEVLLSRITSAAGRVCTGYGDDVRGRTMARACREQAIARAVANVRSPAFAEWVAQQRGRAVGPVVAAAR